MKLTRIGISLLSVVALRLGASCKPKPKPITELQRKEAEHLVAEASFAMNLRDWPRAEGLLAKAVQLNPEAGVYWISLGSMRVRVGNKVGAKEAYQGALKAFEDAATKDETKKDAEPWLKQMQVLALLGRVDEARAMLDKTAKKFPDNRNVKQFVETKAFDKMLADPIFKQGAL
jgi:tetratricopeptide (TPR) repeat protein